MVVVFSVLSVVFNRELLVIMEINVCVMLSGFVRLLFFRCVMVVFIWVIIISVIGRSVVC